MAVTEEVHTEIVNGHYALLQRAEEVHRRCTEALLGGGGVPQVLGILADFSGNPVFLETADGQLLYAAGAGPEGADPLQVWEGLRGQHKDEPPPAGSVLVDVPGGGPGTGLGAGPAGPARPCGRRCAPVHRMAAERAAGILAVVLMQARQEEELAARGRGDFLTDLAEGRITAEDAPAQARVLGFKPGDGPLLPVVMRLGDALVARRGAGRSWPARSRRSWRRWGCRSCWAYGPSRAASRCCWACARSRSGRRSRTGSRRRCGPGVERAGMQRPGAQPPVVVVGVAGGWAAASAGLRHAAETATAAQGLSDRPWYDARRLDIDLLLWRLRDHPDLAAFVDRAIGPLRDHDRRSKPPLLPTLETYLAHAGRKAETARELHLNRQTLYNRLARIGELLGTDLDDPQTVLALSLALRARRHVPSGLSCGSAPR